MSNYSIDSDSPRWWWPSAAIGGAGAAMIAAILVLPATGAEFPDRNFPTEAPAVPHDPWLDTVDPALGRQCYAARWNAGLDHEQPLCGHNPATKKPANVRRPGPNARP